MTTVRESREKEFWETIERTGEIKRGVDHPVVKFFSLQRIEYMRNFIDFNSIKLALDVGCGTGFSSYHFPSNIRITGIDFSKRNLTINHLKNKIQASGYSLPFASDSFDLVYCWDFLHHLEEPLKSVQEMARVTKKYLLMFEPNRDNPVQFVYGLTNKSEHGTLKFHSKKLLEFQEEVGFRLIACENVGWVFAGASPEFSLQVCKHLPFAHALGISSVLLCEKS